MDDRLKYLISEYKDACSISTKPISIKKLPTGHIEDENKSVKWNREFLENNNKKYIEAVANLQRERSLKMNDVQKRIEKYIKDETGVNSKVQKQFLILRIQKVIHLELKKSEDGLMIYANYF